MYNDTYFDEKNMITADLCLCAGVLKAVARDLFDQSVEMTILEQNKEDIGCNQSQEHTAFR